MQCHIAVADLESRFNGTTILYKGIPYYVRTPGMGDPHLILYDFVSRNKIEHTVLHNDPLLDVATPPLGYVQVTPKGVTYLSRRPWRRWKQGIISEALFSEGLTNNAYIFHSKEVFNCMSKNYPDIREVLNLCLQDKDYAEYAVSNDCALVNGKEIVKVYFRKEEVGFITRPGLKKNHPVVTVPSTSKGWLVSKYLSQFFGVK